MTESTTETGIAPPTLRGVTLRHMRVETDFRRDTRGLIRSEREDYSSFLWNMVRWDFQPKVYLADVVGPTREAEVTYGQEGSLYTSVNHYIRRENRPDLIRVLKFYCSYMMQQARKEVDLHRQLFSVFKAVDFARMIVQYSPHCINLEAEALVFGVFHDLGSQLPNRFRGYLETEHSIYNHMKRLQVAPTDSGVRLQLAAQLIRQRSYYDALVQYQYLNQWYPKIPRQGDTKRGNVFIKIAEIFQDLADFTEEGADRLNDARKIKTFIERYNRDFSEKEDSLPIPTGNVPGQLGKIIRGLRQISARWYLRALAVRTLPAHIITEQVMSLAENYLTDRRPKDAQKLLMDGYPYWKRMDHNRESLEDQVNYLKQIVQISVQLKDQKRVDWANTEIRECQHRINEILEEEKAIQARKDALLAGEELPEETPRMRSRRRV